MLWSCDSWVLCRFCRTGTNRLFYFICFGQLFSSPELPALKHLAWGKVGSGETWLDWLHEDCRTRMHTNVMLGSFPEISPGWMAALSLSLAWAFMNDTFHPQTHSLSRCISSGSQKIVTLTSSQILGIVAWNWITLETNALGKQPLAIKINFAANSKLFAAHSTLELDSSSCLILQIPSLKFMACYLWYPFCHYKTLWQSWVYIRSLPLTLKSSYFFF